MKVALSSFFLTGFAASISFAPTALAQPSNGFPTPYPIVRKQSAELLPCYMHTAHRYSLNLMALCSNSTKRPEQTINAIGAYPSRESTTVGGSTSASSNGSGRCNSPTDRASDNSLCGGRATSERPGGR
jgi:hypothetical protein